MKLSSKECVSAWLQRHTSEYKVELSGVHSGLTLLTPLISWYQNTTAQHGRLLPLTRTATLMPFGK